jgi:hypothetical protein
VADGLSAEALEEVVPEAVDEPLPLTPEEMMPEVEVSPLFAPFSKPFCAFFKLCAKFATRRPPVAH